MYRLNRCLVYIHLSSWRVIRPHHELLAPIGISQKRHNAAAGVDYPQLLLHRQPPLQSPPMYLGTLAHLRAGAKPFSKNSRSASYFNSYFPPAQGKKKNSKGMATSCQRALHISMRQNERWAYAWGQLFLAQRP